MHELPSDRPPWVDDWIASPLEAAPHHVAIVQAAGRRIPRVRARLLTFPPGCVARCTCGLGFRCGKPWMIVCGIALQAEAADVLYVSFTPEEYRGDKTYRVSPNGLVLVACRPPWTPETIRSLFDDPDA